MGDLIVSLILLPVGVVIGGMAGLAVMRWIWREEKPTEAEDVSEIQQPA